MVDMNDSGSSAQGSKSNEQLNTIDYIKDFGLWAQGSGCYEHLKVVDDMNNSG